MANKSSFPINKLEGLKKIRKREVPHLHHVLEQIDVLHQLACEARLTVVPGDAKATDRSWRKMLVGAVALVRLKDGTYQTITGYNTKRTSKPNCPTRCCAEELILAELARNSIQWGVDYIEALVVVGDFQVDDTSGVSCSTLHPCGNCRRMLELDEYMRSLTIIVTVQPPHPSRPFHGEVHTRDGLIAKHNII